MACDIHPLTLDDLPELSQFLTAGFHTSPDADFAAVDILRWKYLGSNTSVNDNHGTSPSSVRPEQLYRERRVGTDHWPSRALPHSV